MSDMVQMGVMLVMVTGIKQDVYCDWKHIPKGKSISMDGFNELKELNAITAEMMGYSASNITEETVATDDAMAFDNLA